MMIKLALALEWTVFLETRSGSIIRSESSANGSPVWKNGSGDGFLPESGEKGPPDFV